MTEHHIPDLDATAETIHGLTDDVTVEDSRRLAREHLAQETADNPAA